ncbi:endonuclease/exonuclease/phosphatase family protein [Sphingomonas canadensis]|uniref:Endonuclease/exonuclease/phosphatase family protein n=1 Tax=Sphingomonas canadensis TaxID=1219257 RepID=A0ABW3GZS7_9SPHN|nr:endonuclease/exonuclease/phosphatase family protein [Sphingomonas canadensis]MCW3835359.1 endonuclease/exonuclease/phosphatase family protein [Sphingomonas canadensis]
MTIIRTLRWKDEFRGNPAHQKFVAERLKGLKAALRAQIHDGTGERSLRLATWNLMHFGDGGGYDRTTESMLYIAEIIDHFDLVAVQEVNRDLSKLQELVDGHLGGEWDYLVTDTAGGHRDSPGAGNSERLAFLYRRAKVQFCKEAGEIVLPEGQEIAAPGEAGGSRPIQFARTPFTVAFRSAWLRFKLCTVHIFFGEGAEGLEQRRREIEKIAGFLAQRQEDERDAMIARAAQNKWVRPEDAGRDANYILLGDFNIISPEHNTMQALKAAGFEIPTALQKTDLGSSHHYDQVAIKAAHPGFKVIQSGVFDMLKHVYRDEDADHYLDVVKPRRILEDSDGNPRPRDRQAAYFKQYFRRHQMSDHKLLWCEIAVDYSDDYLDEIAGG